MKKYFLPAALSILFSLLILKPVFSKSLPVKTFTIINIDDPGEKKPAKKSKSQKTKLSLKIYPDILKRMMHVVNKEKEEKEIDFFVFDMQGTLILNYKMKAGSHERIAGLARGKYIYRVFTGDEESANGDFEIK
jgi:hypothetical protein